MKGNKLYSKTVHVSEITPEQRESMFEVFSKYYENSCFNTFCLDLNSKDSVFLLMDKKENKIRGFSTIVNLTYVSLGGKIHRGVFSGDTIIEKEYWGQGTLGVAFLKYLFIEKLKRPFSPLYWYLISKGFKTYLLMANNFDEHWPRHEVKTPEYQQEILNGFSTIMYPEYFDRASGLIKFEGCSKDALKFGVAPITEKLKSSNKRVDFFDRVNPNWQKGDELCCLAVMTLSMPLKYQLKIIKKSYKKISISYKQRLLSLFGVSNISRD
ncbi:conserved hypothetical protein [Halobacteriovorax marinus SJ]|uniref:Uncharacterized protein n=1 Tax=Halobacteriovorax marinus (strain ATCC BAA-682 / DSM 15412 / SJ) TaxID=862908 RepID=E1X1X1_HALMS|nr:hypothetical protein [Halobacteriovorax marinus]CBW26631.1 conserved hypothetical protein [Halobacteriovorax marinus SJ]